MTIDYSGSSLFNYPTEPCLDMAIHYWNNPSQAVSKH